MSEQKREIILYYANWCGHCKTFKPEWQKIKTHIDGLNKTNKMVSYKEYEADADTKVIEKDQIQGFPTIRFNLGGQAVDYDGPRESDAVLNSLLNSPIPTSSNTFVGGSKKSKEYEQCGGSKLSQADYKIKYAKYKAKYFKLLSKMEFN